MKKHYQKFILSLISLTLFTSLFAFSTYTWITINEENQTIYEKE